MPGYLHTISSINIPGSSKTESKAFHNLRSKKVDANRSETSGIDVENGNEADDESDLYKPCSNGTDQIMQTSKK